MGYMIKSFFIKQMVDKLRRQKLWLFVENEKLILNFHTHTKYSGLTTSYLLYGCKQANSLK